jgi:uncharacterized damage-inducible protein DinB
VVEWEGIEGIRPFHVDPAPGFEPLVGRFVTMLADTRRRLHRDLADLDLAELDATLPWAPNSVGTLLYHIAAIELDWAYADLLGTEFPSAASAWFPVDVRDDAGGLSPIVEPYDHHLARLAWTRERLLAVIATLSDHGLDETRSGGDGNGVAWILHHLMQHEAEHRGQIGEIRAALRSSDEVGPHPRT